MMTFKSGLKIFLCLIATFTLSSCSTTSNNAAVNNEQQNVLTIPFDSPPHDKAVLYVYRDNCSNNSMTSKAIYVNGIKIADTKHQTYLQKLMPPTRYIISTESGNNSLPIKMVAGKNYFVKQYGRLDFGLLVGGIDLELVGEEEGRRDILKCVSIAN